MNFKFHFISKSSFILTASCFCVATAAQAEIIINFSLSLSVSYWTLWNDQSVDQCWHVNIAMSYDTTLYKTVKKYKIATCSSWKEEKEPGIFYSTVCNSSNMISGG